MAVSCVSVIIPTYNRWQMLCEGVDSVLGQTYAGYELIVVDDGSEDRTADKLRRKYAGRLSVISQPHRGVAAARNRGVRASRGPWIAFLDSDDLWHPRKLETQVRFVAANPRVTICQTEEIWIRNGVRVNPKNSHRKPSGNIFRASLELCLVSPSAVMMTRDLFETAGGFDEDLPVCEDYDLWLRIGLSAPVQLIRQPLVIKRGGHPDQLSRSTWGLDRFRVRALEKLLATGLGGQERRWILEVLARKVEILARGARKRGKEGEALAYEAIASRALQAEG